MVDTPESIQQATDANKNLAQSAQQAADATKNVGLSAEDSARKLNDLSNTNNIVAKSIGTVGNAFEKASVVLGDFYNKFSASADAMKKNGEATQQQTQMLGLFTSSALGAVKAFDNLSGVDTKSLSTFGSEWKQLTTIINSSPLAGTVEGALGLFSSVLTKIGLPIDGVTNAAKKGMTALQSYAQSMFDHADNALKLQNAYIQLAARTGSLGDIQDAAGPHFNNINSLIENQRQMISDSATATGITTETTAQYYSALGTIPGALNKIVDSNDNAIGSTSMLTAAIQLAKGSGRDFADIVDDMKIAFRDYNIVGEDALQFTARIGEISNKYHVELEDVRNSLRSTADAFKMFGNEAEGAAKFMNAYLGSLEATGISGHAALQIMGGITEAMKGMGIAQKAFLSSQTGGAGGLMGAFQIEEMLREGKIDEVFEKVRQTMGKQFGKLVTLEEASQSQSAAAQLTKQMTLLKQGPLGSFAKDDQSAIRIIEAFGKRERGEVAVKGLSDGIVQDTMSKGVDIQDKSYTELTVIRTLLETMSGNADIANLGFSQLTMTAGRGLSVSPEAEINAQNNVRNLQNYKRGAAEFTEEDMANIGKDRAGQHIAKTIGQLESVISGLGEAGKVAATNAAGVFKSEGIPLAEQRKLYEQNIKEKQASQNIINEAISPRLPGIDVENFGPQNQMRRAALGAANLPSNAAGPTQDNIRAAAHITPKPQEITVHSVIEGYCLNCGTKMRDQSHIGHSHSVGTNLQK